CADDPLPFGSAAIARGQRHIDTRLIDQLQAPHIKRGDPLPVTDTRLLDPCGLTLSRVEGFFCRGKPSRYKRRHMVGTLTRSPRWACSRSHNSSNVASGCCWTKPRTNARVAVSQAGGRPPPRGGAPPGPPGRPPPHTPLP